MDPPPRSLARRSVRLLHGRDPTWFNRIQAWFAGDCSWPMAGSPRIIAWQTTRSRAVCRRARVGQGQAFGGAEEAPSLTLAARDGDGQYAVGAEECSRRGSNKRINKQGRDKMVCTTLDKESPIQAVCPNWARTDLCGGARGNSRPYREKHMLAASISAFDPNVWSGRALQVDFAELAVCGLASMYPASDWSCFAPDHHGYQRACDLVNGQASIGPFGSPVCARARKTEPPFRLILSQTSAGNC